MSYAEEQVAFLKGLMAGWPGMAREMMESILATLSVPSSERVAPAGWKLVPVEPTAAMLKAAWSLKAANAVDTIHGTYRAMLDAAPTAEARAAITGLSREEYDAVVRDAMQWRRLQIEQDKSALSASAPTFTPLSLVEWLQRWWRRDAAWRNEQRFQLGPDVAQLMRGAADMLEQPCEGPPSSPDSKRSTP